MFFVESNVARGVAAVSLGPPGSDEAWRRQPHDDSTAHPDIATAFFHLERTLGHQAPDRLEVRRSLVKRLDERAR